MLKIKPYIFLLLLLIINSCEAPRTNPLDPKNPDNILVQVNGKIETLSLPKKPIASVNVTWENSSEFTKTDSNGNFFFEDIVKKNGWIIFEKNGYSKDSVKVEWDNNSKIRLPNKYLNSIPQLEINRLVSTVYNNHPDRQSYFIEFVLKVTDVDNDIDSVFIKNSNLNIFQSLKYNPTTSTYENTYSVADLNLQSIEQIVGKDFDILVKTKDEISQWFTVGTSAVTRIIKEEIKFKSPANRIEVSVPFTLIWERFKPGFNFKYMIEIYLNEAPWLLRFAKKNISQEAISEEIKKQLTPGSYLWVIWCEDEFGNKARSKSASFIIK